MNKKGFMFAETIIVITVLITALLLIYASFINVLNNEKKRVYYDDVAYVYRTIYLKDFFEKNNTGVLFDGVNESGIIRFNCGYQGFIDDYGVSGVNTSAFCESLLSSLHVDNLYMTNYNISDYKSCPNFVDHRTTLTVSEMCRRLENMMDDNTYSYLKTLRSYGDDSKSILGYRIIAVYKNNVLSKQLCTGANCQEQTYVENYFGSLKINNVHAENKIKNVVVNISHGSTPVKDINIVSGRKLQIAVSASSGYKTSDASISCTNGQNGTISSDGKKFVISKVTNDTVCTVVFPPTCSTAINTTWDFAYTGASQTFTAPCRGSYLVEAWGAQGGNAGGKGAYTTGTINVDANQKFYLFIGGTNGYNGGAPGGIYEYDSNGGGASDVRLANDINNLNSRIMVAAGGGGALVNGSFKAGGGAGGTVSGSRGGIKFYDNGCGTTYATCGACDSTSVTDITCASGNECGCISRHNAGGNQSKGGNGVHYMKYKAVDTYSLASSSDGKFGTGGVPGGGGGFYGGGGAIIAGNVYYGAAGGSSCVNGSLDVIESQVDCSINTFKFNDITLTANNNSGNGKATITLLSSY